ncbi:MAG: sigma-70 family RNA polymerase sigma factor [Polyangiales bacterium]
MTTATRTTRVDVETRALDVTEVAAREGEFLWATLQRMGAREPDLPDLAQEVLIVVHRRRADFDPSLPLRPWLFGICLRVLKAHRRRAWFRRERPVAELPEQVATQPDPERAAHLAQQASRLSSLLATLDPEKRAVFVMFEVEQRACADIAVEMGVPVGTVWSRLHQARKQVEAAVARERARDEGRR